MQVKSIAECSKGSILQFFRPSLNRLPFVIKIFVPLRQILLYIRSDVTAQLKFVDSLIHSQTLTHYETYVYEPSSFA